MDNVNRLLHKCLRHAWCSGTCAPRDLAFLPGAYCHAFAAMSSLYGSNAIYCCTLSHDVVRMHAATHTSRCITYTSKYMPTATRTPLKGSSSLYRSLYHIVNVINSAFLSPSSMHVV